MVCVVRRWVSVFKLFGRGRRRRAGGWHTTACIILAGLRMPAECWPQVWVTKVAAVRSAVMHAVAPVAVAASDCHNTAIDINPAPRCCGFGAQHGSHLRQSGCPGSTARLQSRSHTLYKATHKIHNRTTWGVCAGRVGSKTRAGGCTTSNTSRQQHRVQPRGQGARG